MSKIAVSSPASGTATYTISAPAGSTDRTLTLPDQTATLITNSSDVLNIGSGQVYKDASGNVGIGTSSPGQKLTLGNNGVLRLQTGSVTMDCTPTPGGTDGFVWNTSASSYYDWSIGGTLRARIDSSGILYVGTTSNLYANTSRVNVKAIGSQYGMSIANISAGYQTLTLINEDVGGTRYFAEFRLNVNGVTGVGSITSAGSTTSYNTTSDYRLKEQVQPMQGALAKVTALKPVTYRWKETGELDQGFIAHELQEVIPGAVTGEKDGVDPEGNPRYQGIDTSFLVATLTAAIQELKAIVDAQGAEIAALKGQA